MSSPREFMDCRYCNETTGHTRTAGCIIAVERAAAVNEGWNASGDHPAATLHPDDEGWDALIAQAAANDATRTQYQVVEAEQLRQLATDVIALAQVGGMPDSYWSSDSRISRACSVLGITPEEAREMELPDDDD